MKLVKSVILWFVVLFLVMIALGSIPSIASIAAIVIVSLIAPIASWQSLLQKHIKGKIKVVVIIVMTVLMFATLPDSDVSIDNDGLGNNTSFTETPTELPTESPTVMPTEVPTETPTEPPHMHSFSAATCTAPKTCACGATEGKAKGHSWKEATCSEPKCCTVCGITSGLTAGHKFVNGKCAMCGKKDPDYVKETMVWIPTNGGTKYHSNSWCSKMVNPKQVTQSKAESLGYTPCKKCH